MKLESIAAVRSGVSQDVLNTFWGLAEAKDSTRIDSAERLVVLLKEHTSYEGEGELPESIQYVVKRLIKGLSSSRKFARPGFSMALTEVIQQFSIDTDFVVKQIHDLLKVSKKDSKREQGHTRMAQALAYLAIMQAGQASKLSGDELKEIAETLSKVRSEKHYLHLLGVQAICALVKSVQPKKFRKHVSPVLSDDLTAGWNACTPDNLLLLVMAAQHQPKTVTAEHMQQHWGCSSIMSGATISHISELLAQTVTCHPLVHPVCYELVTMAVQESSGKFFARFWKYAIIEKLLQVEQAQKRYLAFQLIGHALKQAPTADMVSHILSASLIDLLLRCIVHKSDVLYNAARQLVSKIVDFCSAQTQGEIQLAVLNPLLRPPSSVMFDCISQTKTVATIVHNLTASACREYTEQLMKVLLKESDFCSGKDEMSVCKWSGSQLVAVLTVPSVNSDVQRQSSVLQFLMLHSFFKLIKPIPDMEHCQKVSVLESEKSEALRDSFYKALSSLASCYPDKKHSKHEFVSILYNVIMYANHLLLKTPASVTVLSPLSHEVKSMWDRTISVVEELRKQVESSKSENKCSKSRAFQMLFMMFGLHLFLPDTKETMETLQELEICYSRSKKGSKTESADEPEWIEVVTELLVSFMSKSSHLLRLVSANVFGFLQSFLTHKALDVILEVFNTSGTGEEEAVGFEDEEDDDTSSLKENIANSDEDEDVDVDESEDDDDSDDESSDDVDPGLRAAVKNALGKAAAVENGDEATGAGEDAEEADMSDSEMFRLDDALAAAFRSMKRHGPAEKERNKQLLHFKLRCIDLLEQLVKEGARTDLMLELLAPLVLIMEAGITDKDQKILGDRATSLYHRLCKLKKINDVPLEARSSLPEKLKEMIELSTRVSGVPLALEVCSGCQFLLRAASAHNAVAIADVGSRADGDCTVDGLVAVVREALELFLTHRESRLSHFIFQQMLERHPEVFWPLHDLLLRCAASSEVRIFCRTQAWSLLSLLLHKNIVETVGRSEWTKFTRLINEAFEKVVSEVSVTDNFKPRYVQELFGALVKAEASDPELVFNISKLGQVKHLFTKPIKKLYAKLSASKRDSEDTANASNSASSQKRATADVDDSESKPRSKKQRNK